MNAKITTAVQERTKGKPSDELVLLTLRTNVVLATEEIELLTGWNAKLLYDNGNLVLLYLPVGRLNDIAAWDCVIEVR